MSEGARISSRQDRGRGHGRSSGRGLEVEDALLRLVRSRTIHHFLILYSLSNELCRAVLERIACGWIEGEENLARAHPDIFFLKPQGKSGMYSVEGVRVALAEANLTPFQGSGRAFCIEGGERLSPSAANALLKALEEPPKGCLFLMTATNLENLLPTILSRAQIVRLGGEGGEPDPASLGLLEQMKHVREALFSSPLARPSYREVVDWAERLTCLFEEERGRREALLEGSLEDGEDGGALFSTLSHRVGEEIVEQLRLGWRSMLCCRSQELCGPSNERRFPDETLLAFHEALCRLSLQLKFSEISLQLLLKLFGYVRFRTDSRASLLLNEGMFQS